MRFSRTVLLITAAMAVSCAQAQPLPEPTGPSLAPGMYSLVDGDDPLVEVSSGSDEAWDANFYYPALDVPTVRRSSDRSPLTADGPITASAWLWFRAYKETLSRVDGGTCRFYPSCSQFGLDAVRAHGLLGVPMTFGRLHKNHGDDDRYPMSRPPFLDDPIANYGFSLRRPKLDDFASYENPAHAWYMHLRAVRNLRYDPVD